MILRLQKEEVEVEEKRGFKKVNWDNKYNFSYMECSNKVTI